ncbi:MAG TPA: hypothetical protein DCM62_01395 [Bacteroidales bacterium]|nr:hypothetical protein [Bacteroidales bacterium]
MKKLLVIFALLLVSAPAFSQRFAYIDTDYIMDNIPEFRVAEEELQRVSNQWQEELESLFANIERMYRDYQAEAPLLPEAMRRQREENIIERERQAKELQMQRFGREGDLFKKRQELIRPIQERVANAVKELATSENFAIIFDRAGAMTMVFADVRFDMSDEVLRRLGYRR